MRLLPSKLETPSSLDAAIADVMVASLSVSPAQRIAKLLEASRVEVRKWYDDENVDDGFSWQMGDGCASYVLD